MNKEIYVIKRLSLNFVAVHRVNKIALNAFIQEKSKRRLHFQQRQNGVILHAVKEGL